MNETPNHALQRTATAVTACAADRRHLSTHRHSPRQPPPSLSLRSLGATTTMQDLIEFAAIIAKKWTNKTLEDLRVEAERADTGIMFDAVRSSTGGRALIVACVTDLDQISRLEKALDLVDDGITEDWNTLSLSEVSMRSWRAGGLCFESLRDEYGRRSALALIAASPDSIRIIEAIFEMPA